MMPGGLDIGSIFVRIEADLTNLTKGLDNATKSIKSKMESAAEGSKVLLGGLAVVGAGVVAFGAKALKMAGDMEQSQVAFTTMLGSAEKATNLMKELQKFGAETPFEFPEIQKSAKSLLAFGVGAADVTETLRRIGDVASGVGAPLGEIAELYGKAKVQGRLFAEDINQLTGRGIPIIQELAKQFGVNDSQVKDLVENGKIGFPQLETAFKNLTATGSQFGGMMAAQSQTLPGMWSNLMDNIGQSAVILGQTLITTFDLKTKLAGVIEFLGQISAALQTEGLQGALDKIFPPDTQAKIVIIAGAIAGALVPAIIALAAGIWAAIAPLIPFMAAGAALAALALVIYKAWDPVTKFFKDTWTTTINFITNLWNGFKTFTLNFWKVLVEGIIGAFKWLYDHNYYFKNLVDNITAIWGELQASTTAIWNAITGFLSGIWNSIATTASTIWNRIVGIITDVGTSISTILSSLGEKAYEWGANLLSEFTRGVSEKIENLKEKVRRAVAAIKSLLGFHNTGEEGGGGGGEVPGFANGVNNFRGGAAIVGERGPELLNLPGGTDVIPADKTKQMLGQTINYEGMFNGAVFNVRSDNDVKMIAREIFNMQQSRARGNGVVYG